MSVVKGHSAKLEFGDQPTFQDSSNWTAIASITDLKPPTVKATEIDTSTMESEEQFEESEAGWAEGGEVECTAQFNADDADTLYGKFRVTLGWRVTFSNGSRWNVTAYINEFGNETERKGVVTTKLKLKISGKPHFVKAA